MARLNIKSYEPTYIGKPVEAISSMLQKLDANNERITESYRTLNNTLAQLDINDLDAPIINKYKGEIESRLSQALESDDYGTIGNTIKSSYDNMVNSPELIAAVSRNKQYNDYRNAIAEMYYKGAIDKSQYDYYYNTPFSRTMPDDNGVFNRTYNLQNPAKAIDVPAFASKTLSTIMQDGSSGEVNEYMTNAEVAKLTGQDLGNLDPNAKSSFKKYSKYVSSVGMSKDKRRKILKDAFMTDPEARAYIDDLARINAANGTPKTQAEIIDEFIEPYVQGSGYVTQEQERDNDMKFLYQQAMLNQRAADNRTYKSKTGEEKPLFDTDNIESVGTLRIGQGVEGIGDDLNTTFNFNLLTSEYDDFRLDPTTPTYSKEAFINEVARSKYNKSFNELNQSQRRSIIAELEEKNEYLDNELQVMVQPYTTDASDIKTEELFGNKNIKFKEGESITGIVGQRGLYNIKTGESVPAGKVKDYLDETYKEKNVNIRVLGRLSGDNPIVEQTGNFQYYNGDVVNINGDLYAIPGSYYSPDKYSRQFVDAFSKVQQGRSAYRYIDDPQGERQVNGQTVSHELNIARVKETDPQKPNYNKYKLILRTNGKGKLDAENQLLRPQVFEAYDPESLYMQYQQWVNSVQDLYNSKSQNVGYKQYMR